MHYTKLSARTKDQLVNNHSRLLENLPETFKRTAIEYSYGILQSGDVLLSSAARALNEKINTTKTIERLSRNLSDDNFEDSIQTKYIENVATEIDETWVEVIDMTDIAKPRAKKMEGLAHVYDGSEGEIAKGYWLLRSVAVRSDRKEVRPLMMNLFSVKEPGFISMNHKLEIHTKKLQQAGISYCVQVLDSGFSGENQLKILEKRGRFVVRINKKRNVLIDKTKQDIFVWAQGLKLPHAMTVTKLDGNGKPVTHSVAYETRCINLGNREGWAVVMRLDDHEPCILFTNQSQDDLDPAAFGAKIINQYGCRWSVEEFIRFEKQQFNYENVRVRSLVALKNVIALINVLSGFVVKMSLRKIARQLIQCAKPIKEDVRFVYYRIADGLKAIFSKRAKAPFAFKFGGSCLLPDEQLTFSCPGAW